ncbi:hypothetical protein K2173_009591 [Erythroxylum novogranatense]|uniref:FHA domain-containing protein n=1 Tax=Erythroxylum novogranatense TaxID=1862640 RepID=A0AAV8U4H2_9ROSI|nr:hypothetical protein K2173_009591 [Erythroxylum novogranatense]
MEIEGEDGSKMELKAGSNTMFGRGSGFNTNDRTVSRQHVLFQLENQTESPHRVSFEVIGKNPIWVRSTELGNGINVFKKSEKGGVVIGDGFCISSQNPVWFTVKGVGGSVETRVLESESGSELGGDLEEVDVCGIDPVKEFGFLVIGHEFDSYPKIRNVKDWDWFLEESETEGDSEDDGNEERARKGKGKRKRKKRVGGNEEDDDWTGESEDDKQVVARISKVGRPKYMTRSKGLKQTNEKAKRKRTSGTKREYPNEEDNDEDETLGGFIVDDDEDIDDQLEVNDEFEEEEFLDDEEQDN